MILMVAKVFLFSTDSQAVELLWHRGGFLFSHTLLLLHQSEVGWTFTFNTLFVSEVLESACGVYW